MSRTGRSRYSRGSAVYGDGRTPVRRFAMTLTMALAGAAAVATTAEAATFTIAPVQAVLPQRRGSSPAPAPRSPPGPGGHRGRRHPARAVTADAAGGFVTPPITLGRDARRQDAHADRHGPGQPRADGDRHVPRHHEHGDLQAEAGKAGTRGGSRARGSSAARRCTCTCAAVGYKSDARSPRRRGRAARSRCARRSCPRERATASTRSSSTRSAATRRRRARGSLAS